MNSVEEKIRKLKMPQLEVLKLIASSPNGITSSKELGGPDTSVYQLGALITPLRRLQSERGRLIIPAGREADNSVRWQINENVITRQELKELLAEMNI